MASLFFFYSTFFVCILNAFRSTVIYIFVLYQAFYFLNPQTKWWGSSIPNLRYSFYIVLTLLIITVFSWKKSQGNEILKIPQFLFLYLMVFLYAAITPFSVFPDSHLTALDYIMTVTVLITAVFKLVQNEKDFDLILKAYVLFSGYLGYYISQIGRTSSGRFEGAGMVDAPDGNGVGAAIAPAAVLCLYFFWVSPRLLQKAIYLVLGAFMANALVQIGSRGAFLGVGVSVGLFFWKLYFSKSRKQNQRLSVIVLVVCALMGGAIVTDKIFWNRVTSMVSQSDADTKDKETGATRFIFWKGSIDMARDYPFGQGSRSFLYYSPVYIPTDVDTGKKRNRAVHSTWFEALTEIGYLGMLSLMGCIYFCYKTTSSAAKQLLKKEKLDEYYKVVAVQCCLTSFVVSMTFLNRLRGELLYWCILFCAIAYNIYYLKPKYEKTRSSVATR